MKNIKIFKENLKIDLAKFIDSRALICANSGGGKSYAVRKILEEASENKVMSIILDVEGEFRTLKEKYDFLLIGEGGDLSLNVKSAKLLPEKIMSLDMPTIIDISDLKRNERIRYVKDFLEALMELPRKGGFWKPCIVVLDEAHLLAGQQEKQDSCSAVIDLMTRGRKRGYCGILCTQRISKLHKDAVAECNNYMIGRTGLDIDMKRASEILGFTNKKDMLGLRDLGEGEFYVFGTAISRAVVKQKVAMVKTIHPKAGMDLSGEVVKPTDKIIAMLSKLKDLPQEAEKKLKEVQDYKKEINELKRNIRVLENSKPKPQIDEKSLERAKQQGFMESERKNEKLLKVMESNCKKLERKISDAGKILGKEIVFQKIERTPTKSVPEVRTKRFETPEPVSIPRKSSIPRENIPSNGNISAGAKRMLKAIASYFPNNTTKQRVAAISGLSYKSGTFSTYLATLKREGLIESQGGLLMATNLGMEEAGDVEAMPTNPEELLSIWVNIVKGGASRMLKVLFENYPNELSREELGDQSDITYTSGTFGTYLATLKRNGLIKVNSGMIKMSEEFFE